MLKLRIVQAREVARTEFTLGSTLARGAVCIVVGVLAACQTPQPIPIAPMLSGRSPVASAPSPSPPAVTSNPVYKVGEPYQVGGIWYYPQEQPAYDETGIASWYGIDYQGRPTANGEVFDRMGVTGASPTLPMPVNVRVTNLQNGRSLVVRVNDRGPYVKGRILDLSEHAADMIGLSTDGHARV